MSKARLLLVGGLAGFASPWLFTTFVCSVAHLRFYGINEWPMEARGFVCVIASVFALIGALLAAEDRS